MQNIVINAKKKILSIINPIEKNLRWARQGIDILFNQTKVKRPNFPPFIIKAQPPIQLYQFIVMTLT